MTDKKEYIKYRVERARETFQDALYLAERGSWNSCINRLYYAAFYAVIAMLLLRNIEVKSHAGVKQKLGKELVKEGLLSKELAKSYSLLFDFCHKGDYDDLFDFDKEKVEPLFEPVRTIIEIAGHSIKA
jgi:uncharacterized protein (UPF0332 family)